MLYHVYKDKIYLDKDQHDWLVELVESFGWDYDGISCCGSLYFYKNNGDSSIKLRVSNHEDTGRGYYSHGSNDVDLVNYKIGILTGHNPICDFDEENMRNAEIEDDWGEITMSEDYDYMEDLKYQGGTELNSIKWYIFDRISQNLKSINQDILDGRFEALQLT